jgi:serine/threonine protein kinase
VVQERILDNTYRLLEEIGRGGFGAVYRGVRIGAEGSGQVAIKLLNRNPSLKSEELIRFQREATLMSHLVHPGIVTVSELSEDNGNFFIVMEFISGANLRDFVKAKGGKLSLIEIVEILIQAAEALEYVHSHDIVHRDIKPQNMLVIESREHGETRIQVKLVDFGVARLSQVSSGQRAQGLDSVVGTYAYMAPEATGLVDWEFDSRVDIYSLGIVAYELVAGKVPFHDCRNDDILRAHVEKEPPDIREIRGQDVPSVIEKIIKKCIAKHPQERYQSMFALVCDLKRILVDFKSRGLIEDFPIATKDIGIGKLLERAFIGRDPVVCEVLEFVENHQQESDVLWIMIRGGIGLGKTKCLGEIRNEVELRGLPFVSLRFSESEQRLPFQSLSLAVNDFIGSFSKTNRTAFKTFLTALAKELGPLVDDLGRLIPVLRQFSGAGRSDDPLALQDGDEGTGQDGDDVFSIGSSVDRRYVAPNQRVNDAFLKLFSMLVDRGQRLIFLLDDLHLADTSTLTLFLYLLEQRSSNSRFSFVFTARDKFSRANLILENFIKRLSMEQRSFRLWTLLPFDRAETSEFLRAIGMVKPDDEFIENVLLRTNGAPLQLNALVKQMLAQDVLVPRLGDEHQMRKAQMWRLEVDWTHINNLVLDYVNVEMLIASLENMDKRDFVLMRVAAVCQDACEFEYFAIENDYSGIELESRIMNLVRRGIFEMIGEEHAPLQRRAFVFSHEKLRNAVMSRLDMETRRQIHFLLVGRIEAIHRTPRREHLLALAKHYDGAGDKVKPSAAVRAFLRGGRIYVNSGEYNLARYYIDKAMDATARVSGQRERIQRLRECYEAEYMFQAAQGNLVEASEVCRNLIEITFDPVKKEVLQIFWAQLLLGLGRHQHAYRQARSVLESRGVAVETRFIALFAFLNYYLLGSMLQRYLLPVLHFVVAVPRGGVRETHTQAVMMMMLTHIHGNTPHMMNTLLLATRMRLSGFALTRHNVILAVAQSSLMLRDGHVSQAFRLYEECEHFLISEGMQGQARQALAMRCLWLDYPMGRMERLLAIVDNESGANLPLSGIMHFEAFGMRAWMMLLSPSCKAAKAAASNESRRRRRSDRPGGDAGQGNAREILLENNAARRILDSGENSQYTALTVFSDAIRSALSEKIEPLRQATEQLRRQTSVSAVGDAFADFAYAFQSLVLGHQHEALKFYFRASHRLMGLELEIVSLVVADALRLAVLVLPLFAVSFQARGWPWGSQLRSILVSVDNALSRAEGLKNPRRNAMTPLFRGFVAFMDRRRSESFKLLEEAIKAARDQRSELVECLALSLLAGFSGQMRLSRAVEHFKAALRVAQLHDLRILERQIMGMAKLVHVNLEAPKRADQVVTGAQTTREKQTTLGLNEIVFKMQKLHASSSIEELLGETVRIVMSALRSNSGIAYLLETSNGRDKFVGRAFEGAAGNQEFNDHWILKLLPRSADDPVRVLPMSDEEEGALTESVIRTTMVRSAGGRLDSESQTVGNLDEESGTVAVAPTSVTAPNVEVKEEGDERTAANEAQMATVTATATIAGTAALPSEKTRGPYVVQAAQKPQATAPQNSFLVLIAITANRALMGWIAIPGVLASTYSSREVEQDLVLVGLHVGHILSRVYEREGIDYVDASVGGTTNQQGVADKLKEITDGEIPKDVLVEAFGKVAAGHQTAWRIYRMKPRRVMVAQWKFQARPTARARHLGELVGRHLRFYVYSVRQSSESTSLENLMIKLASDLITIFETASKEGRFDFLSLNILVWDADERRAVEGDFGGEQYSFTGTSEVEREYLQEIHGILTSDRLVYHERIRRVSGSGGWLFSPSERGQALFPHFAQVDFVDNYLAERNRRPGHLGSLLGLEKGDILPLLALFTRGKSEEE